MDVIRLSALSNITPGGLCVLNVVCCCASDWVPAYWGFVCCDCGAMLSVAMGYRILGGLCVVTVVCSCASVWGAAYWGVLML